MSENFPSKQKKSPIFMVEGSPGTQFQTTPFGMMHPKNGEDF